jgi:hypothetical protein
VTGKDVNHDTVMPVRSLRSPGGLRGHVPANKRILAFALQARLQGERQIEPGLFERIELQWSGPDIRAHR